MTKADVVRALHVLIARCHLHLAGEYDLTRQEWILLDDIDRFVRTRKRTKTC